MRSGIALTLAFLVPLLSVALQPALVAACSFDLPPTLEIVANPSDQTPPSSPAASVVKVKRGDEWSQGGGGGCSNVASSCDGSAFVRLRVAANDDTSQANELGYVFETTSAGIDVPRAPVLADENGEIMLFFNGNDDGTEDVRFNLQVFSVDKAGNISTQPIPLTVTNEGSTCQIARTAPAGMLWCTVLALALAARQRRLRRRQPSEIPQSPQSD